MKIIFFQSQFKMGGQQKIVKTIAESLNVKYEVTVYYENHNFFNLNALRTIRVSKRNQILNFLKVIIKNKVKFFKNRRELIDLWHLENVRSSLGTEEFDVVVLCNPYILFSEEIKKITRAKRVICWTHNIYENYVDSRFKSEKEKLFQSMMKADKIVCLERYTADKWRQINKNVTVIHNPVTIDCQNKRADLKSRKIACVGRIQIDSKGLDLLCEVISYLDNNITVEFAGSGNKENEKKFNALIKRNGVKKKINLVGSLNDNELIDHYSGSSIFLITSRFEGFPLVVAEAMSFGLPIVGFDIPALREVTMDGTYGILTKLGDTKAQAKCINDLINSEYLLNKYQKLSFKRASQLSLSKITHKWEKLLLDSVNTDG